MEITIENNDAVAVVLVDEDIKAATVPQLRDRYDELLNEGWQEYMIDLTEVPFLDSSGLATLVQLFRRVRIGNVCL